MAVAIFMREELRKLTAGPVYRQTHLSILFWRRNKVSKSPPLAAATPHVHSLTHTHVRARTSSQWVLRGMFVIFPLLDVVLSVMRRRLWAIAKPFR